MNRHPGGKDAVLLEWSAITEGPPPSDPDGSVGRKMAGAPAEAIALTISASEKCPWYTLGDCQHRADYVMWDLTKEQAEAIQSRFPTGINRGTGSAQSSAQPEAA